MCLVYNVVCSSPEEAPDFKTFTREGRRRVLLANSGARVQVLLGYSMEHAYTLNQCGFDDLKGRDRVVANVIRDAKGVFCLWFGKSCFPLWVLDSSSDGDDPSC